MNTLVFATRNKGKLRELRHLVEDLPLAVRAIDDFEGAPDVEETGETFLENAALKALSAYRHIGQPSLADDSGLCVEALEGAPGVRSSRFGGVEGDSARNNRRLLEVLADHTGPDDRRAWFQATLVLLAPRSLLKEDRLEGAPRPEFVPEELGIHVHVGRTHGRIIDELRGTDGFGYDPLFLSDDAGVTFAELPLEEKSAISHRGRAFATLRGSLAELCR